MSVLVTAEFWSAAAERAVKTVAQALVAVLTVAGVTPLDIDWKGALLTAALAGVVSLLMSVASAGAGNPGPSLASETLAPKHQA